MIDEVNKCEFYNYQLNSQKKRIYQFFGNLTNDSRVNISAKKGCNDWRGRGCLGKRVQAFIGRTNLNSVAFLALKRTLCNPNLQSQIDRIFLAIGEIKIAFASIVHIASRHKMVFDEKQKKLVPWIPTYTEFVSNRDKYPEFEETFNWETGQLEIT